MQIASQSLVDVLKQILQTLQVPFLLPSGSLVLLTYLLLPVRLQADDAIILIGTITLSIFISYLLYAFNLPLIRVAEGYTFEQSCPFKFALYFERRRYQRMKDEITDADKTIIEIKQFRNYLQLHGRMADEIDQQLHEMEQRWNDRKRPLQERLELRYPLIADQPLPTALGNTIRAFEDYPWVRYRMDAVHLWPRFLPVLEERKFLAFVRNEKAVFDFLINLSLVALIVDFELLMLFAFVQPTWAYLLGFVALLGIAYLLYRGAVIAAQQWGGMVRVAFDLYRDDLRRALYLGEIPNHSLHQERRLWEAISNFIAFGNEDDFPGFVYSQPPAPQRRE